jgi:hypothetical protein
MHRDKTRIIKVHKDNEIDFNFENDMIEVFNILEEAQKNGTQIGDIYKMIKRR